MIIKIKFKIDGLFYLCVFIVSKSIVLLIIKYVTVSGYFVITEVSGGSMS